MKYLSSEELGIEPMENPYSPTDPRYYSWEREHALTEATKQYHQKKMVTTPDYVKITLSILLSSLETARDSFKELLPYAKTTAKKTKIKEYIKYLNNLIAISQ